MAPAEARIQIAAALRARRAEIEGAALARATEVAETAEALDPQYAEGLREAVSTALAYGIDVVESGEDRQAPVPEPLLVQARRAASRGIGLDTVLRRYISGFTLFGDYLLEESDRAGVPRAEVQDMVHLPAARFDRLVAAVSEEYAQERERRMRPTEWRRVELVRRLLSSDPVEEADLDYELDHWHLAVIAAGPDAGGAIRELARAADRRHLIAEPAEGVIWAWLGGRQRLSTDELLERARPIVPAEFVVAVGEPAQGLEGWRLSHQQAAAAFPIAVHRGEGLPMRYANVALLAAVLQDELLVRSLRQIYLGPLSCERDGGAVLRETLRAYFVAEHNVSSAAAELGVKRHTVTNRLRTVEERIGRTLSECAVDLSTALQLDQVAELANRQWMAARRRYGNVLERL